MSVDQILLFFNLFFSDTSLNGMKTYITYEWIIRMTYKKSLLGLACFFFQKEKKRIGALSLLYVTYIITQLRK